MSWLADNSVDLFGAVTIIVSIVVGTSFLKPEWPPAYVGAASVVGFLALLAVFPNRKPGEKPKTKAS